MLDLNICVHLWCNVSTIAWGEKNVKTFKRNISVPNDGTPFTILVTLRIITAIFYVLKSGDISQVLATFPTRINAFNGT